MRATVSSVIRFRADALPRPLLARLVRALSFPNPAYLSQLRFGRGEPTALPEVCVMEQARDGTVTLPRGAVQVLQSLLESERLPLEFEDRRTTLPPLPLALKLIPRDYQREAAEALYRGVQGLVVAPCGAGKTVIGAAALARAGQPALVLVHTLDLLAQWQEALRAALGVEAGVVSDGRADLRPVTVATVQTLAALEPEALEALGGQFGAVVLDEAHHAPASTFRRVLGRLGARYRFGLTATPERPDGLTPLLELCLGPVRYRIQHEALVAAGHLIVPRVVPVHTGCPLEAHSHGELVAALVADPERNERLVNLLEREVRAGHAVLVLSARVEHCEQLASLLRARGVEAGALTGAVPRARRAALLERFRAGGLPVLCATSLADEGLDVSRLERLVLATPARAEGRTVQRLGRLMRPHPGKRQPVLYDLVDEAPMARRHFQARARAYRKVLGAGAISPPEEAR